MNTAAVGTNCGKTESKVSQCTVHLQKLAISQITAKVGKVGVWEDWSLFCTVTFAQTQKKLKVTADVGTPCSHAKMCETSKP